MGGFDKVIVDWSPEIEGLDAGDGRRMGLTGCFTTFEAAVVDLVSGRSNLGSERSRIATRETNLGTMKQGQGWQRVVSQIWRMLCVLW
jgi:hypothetical protein